ncbi:MAG TPA: toxin-antitoxin system HicB family antitoxin [Gaiella sp.]|uniref:toxin-antitoxin system HicB family antitoxin n=1 Tax=Gaiella sp. TaxID=2663207 RepID=UPI002D7ECBB0|nr:toxin-antitoxin system HicB family antitoxin [Gaiella sp.]HET9286893.1 toxin-antitoxin system HicB family antitoxin [Gaiella sp.]
MSAQPSASEVDEASRTKTPSPSGRLLLRMPPDLHGELAQAAEREGTSLNGYIIARLSESVGRPAGDGESGTRHSSVSPTTLTRLLVANVVAVTVAAAAAVVILLVAWLG